MLQQHDASAAGSSYDASSSCNIALAARAASSPASGLPPTALPPMTFAATKTLPEAGQTALTALLHSSPVDGANDAQISSDEDMEPDMKGSHRSGGTSGAGPHINMSIAQLEAKRHTMSEKEYKRLRRCVLTITFDLRRTCLRYTLHCAVGNASIAGRGMRGACNHDHGLSCETACHRYWLSSSAHCLL